MRVWNEFKRRVKPHIFGAKSSKNSVEFEPSSFLDPVGRIFYKDGKVFRGIRPPFAHQANILMGLARQHNWYEQGLVSARSVDMKMPDFGVVLEHDKVPFFTTRAEWSYEGIRDAALLQLRLNVAMMASGWGMKDAHPWNIMFDGPRPVFVDWGSITPIEQINPISYFAEFRNYLLVPLHLFSIGESKLARSALREHHLGVGLQLAQREDAKFSPAAADEILANKTLSVRDMMLQLINYVSELKFPVVEGAWSVYAQQDMDTPVSEMAPKHQLVHSILTRDKGNTLFDIGASWGLHASMASRLGKTVLAGDVEETVVSDLYRRTAREGRKISSIFYNFLHPMPSTGLLGTIPGSNQRLACDTVMMLAVTHHLVFAYGLDFDRIAGGLRKLTKRRLVVEFVSPEDVHVKEWAPERLPWYRLDVFTESLTKHFGAVSVEPIGENATRFLLICEGPL